MSDLLAEIKEDMREEQLQKFWRHYGSWVIGVVIAILAGAAIGIGWQNWNERRQKEHAADFSRAVKLEPSQYGEAEAIYMRLAKTSSGFAVLSKLRLATHALHQGTREKALEHLKEIELAKGGDAIYRDFAKLMRIHLSLDQGAPIDDLLKDAESLTHVDNPWRPMALEAKAALLMKRGDKAMAQAIFSELAASPAGRASQAFHERTKALAQALKLATEEPAQSSH